MFIVKRRGKKQQFDDKKLYGSIYAACLSAHIEKEQSALISNSVLMKVSGDFANFDEVTSDQIFQKTIVELAVLSKDASFMYQTHRDLS